MWPCQIEHGTDRDDSSRINFGVRHVIMALDVIEIDGVGDIRLLIQVHQISLQVWIIDNATQIALKMAVINDIEADKRAEQSPIGFYDAIVKQIVAFGQALL